MSDDAGAFEIVSRGRAVVLVVAAGELNAVVCERTFGIRFNVMIYKHSEQYAVVTEHISSGMEK